MLRAGTAQAGCPRTIASLDLNASNADTTTSRGNVFPRFISLRELFLMYSSLCPLTLVTGCHWEEMGSVSSDTDQILPSEVTLILPSDTGHGSDPPEPFLLQEEPWLSEPLLCQRIQSPSPWSWAFQPVFHPHLCLSRLTSSVCEGGMGDGMESLAEVKTSSIPCAPFTHLPVFSSRKAFELVKHEFPFVNPC